MTGAQSKLDILIRTVTDLSGLQKLHQETNQLVRELHSVTAASARGLQSMQSQANGLLSSLQRTTQESLALRRGSTGLQGAFDMGVGIVSVTALAGSIQQLGSALQGALEKGVAFRSNLEDAQLGIAAVMKQFDRGRLADFTQALAASGEALDLLAEKARTSPATFESLVGAFQGTTGAMSAAGLEMREQVELITLMSQALAGLGIRSEQMLQETRAIITGNINADAAAAKILDITSGDIAAAKERGELYAFLTKRLAAFKEAALRSSDSLTVLKSNLQDAYTQAAAAETDQLTEALKKLYKELGHLVSSDQFGDFVRMLANHAADAVGALTDLSTWARENSSELKAFGEAALYAVTALGALKLISLASAWSVQGSAIASLLVGGIRSGWLMQAGGLAMVLKEALATPLGAAMTSLGFAAGLALAAYAAAAISDAIVDTNRAESELENAPWYAANRQSTRLSQARDMGTVDSVRSTAERYRADAQGSLAALPETGTAWNKERENLSKLISFYDTLIKAADTRGEQIVRENQAADAQAAKIEAARAATAKANEANLAAAADLEAAQKAEQQALWARMSDLEKEAALEAKLLELQTERKAIMDRSLIDGGQSTEALQAAIDGQRAALARNHADAIMAALELERLQSAREASGPAAGGPEGNDARLADRAAELALNNALAASQAEVARIEADRFLTEEEKNAKILPQLREQNRLIQERINKLREEQGLTPDPVRRGQIDGEISGLEGQQRENSTQITTRAPLDVGGEVTKSSNEMINSIGSVAHQIAGVWSSTAESMRTSMGQAFSDMILRGKDFKDAAAGFALSIGTAFVEATAQMVADWIMSHIVMRGIKKLFVAEDVATTALAEGAKTTLTASGETTRVGIAAGASGAKVGIAASEAGSIGFLSGIAGVFRSIMELGPVAGPMVFAASIAGMIALVAAVMGGFREGGYTGPGAPDQVAGVVHAGEYVMNAGTVARYGVGFMERLATGALEAGDLALAAPAAMAAQARREVSPAGAAPLARGGTAEQGHTTILAPRGRNEEREILESHSGRLVRLERALKLS